MWDFLLRVEDEEASAVFVDGDLLVFDDKDLCVVTDHEGLGEK